MFENDTKWDFDTPVEIVKSLKTILNAQTRDMYQKLWFFMQILER